MGYIYLRKNLSNGKKYVGQTTNIKDRNYAWNNLSHHYAGKAIDAARAKYGIDAFDFEILKECKDKEMNQWEMYYIKELNTKTPYGYNMTDGGDSIFEMTDEVRKKIADALRGKKQPNISAAKRGKKRSEETKAKISAALRGRKLPAEVVAKVAAAHRGKKQSPEHIAKRADAHRGKYNNPNMSKAVQALDKNGNVVMEFPSAMEAQRQYGFDASTVSKCCLGKLKTHKGYVWRFAV